MLNEKLIAEATKLAVEYFHANYIAVTTEPVRQRAVMYYNNTEVVDAETLAALVLEAPPVVGLTWMRIQEIKEYYFPTIPVEYCNIHCEELSLAQMDQYWM